MLRSGSLLGLLVAGLAAAEPSRPAEAQRDASVTAATAEQSRAAKVEAELNQLRERIAELASELDADRGDLTSGEQQLLELERRISRTVADIERLNADVVDEEQVLAALAQERSLLDQEVALQRSRLTRELTLAARLNRRERLQMLLNQQSTTDLADALAALEYLTRRRVERHQSLTAALARVAENEEAIRSRGVRLAELKRMRESELENLRSRQQLRLTVLGKLRTQIADRETRLRGLERDEQGLLQLLASVIDLFEDIPRALISAQSFGAKRGTLSWPLDGDVVLRFGAKRELDRASTGMLISAEPGSPVRALHAGRVAFADWLRGYGMVVIVEHGDEYLSLYGRNQALLAEVGDWVLDGDVIARSGDTGTQDDGLPAGLYLEVRRGREPQNPLRWLKPKAG